ncbi:MAG: ABC transporter ATP-binding protein [Candidatus Omnitrophota bacterium]|nr:ABC transporter ATP-binding protein [Candidatus Omnitrophota bacterium]
MAAAPDLLSVEDLHVRYGSVEVLKGISLKVRRGEIVALIGANGAGKSTALMAISGIVPASKGSIRFSGREIRSLPSEQRVSLGITQVPEGRRLFPRMTVKENLLIGATLRTDRSEIEKDLAWVLKLFPVLKKRSLQLAGTLSGGEQQMLALARGLMAKPTLLLLDEPSLGLAPKLIGEVFSLIRKIHEMGITLLLVEQNAYQALQVAQTAYVLETGTIALHGPAERLRQDPSVKRAYLGG